MSGEEGSVDVDEVHVVLGTVPDDVQASEDLDARQRDVRLTRREGFPGDVHEVIHGPPLCFVNGARAREDERELMPDVLPLADAVRHGDLDLLWKDGHDVAAEFHVTGVGVLVVLALVGDGVEAHERDGRFGDGFPVEDVVVRQA